MPFFGFVETPLIIFLVIVAPVWIIAHYTMRWRSAKTLTSGDEQILTELWESVPKMESRIKNLERILDAEVPDWREQL
ncbi:MAG: envelope stress response membrane protein PspB [Rhodospirillales bacterium]|nr:envelope stress response membrane protein PspB [Rhodospirillales bacterium]